MTESGPVCVCERQSVTMGVCERQSVTMGVCERQSVTMGVLVQNREREGYNMSMCGV